MSYLFSRCFTAHIRFHTGRQSMSREYNQWLEEDAQNKQMNKEMVAYRIDGVTTKKQIQSAATSCQHEGNSLMYQLYYRSTMVVTIYNSTLGEPDYKSLLETFLFLLLYILCSKTCVCRAASLRRGNRGERNSILRSRATTPRARAPGSSCTRATPVRTLQIPVPQGLFTLRPLICIGLT